MDLTLTTEETAFRDEVRAWIEANHPGPAPQGGDQVQYEFEREWQRKLHEAGWAGGSLPEGDRGPPANPVWAGDLGCAPAPLTPPPGAARPQAGKDPPR